MSKLLFEELKKYGEGDFYPFHMPGHKRNPDSGPLSEIYRCDITEIDGFDNLHQAEGILKDAQEKAASLYHSKETFFLVNGSTSGILTAISAVASRGRKMIIARNCHKAVYHGVFLNQLEAEYIYPKMIDEFGISDGITAEQIENKIRDVILKEGVTADKAADLIAGVVITSPTYDGILSDVRGIVKVAHSYGVPVIVDQAHGAHFGFHPGFPESAVAEGTDIVIHSVHKTLPAPTQTALLHCNSLLVNMEAVKKYLRIYQSSSPSYLLMAGIDACMELVKEEGADRLEQLLAYREELEKKAKKLKKIKIYPSMLERKRSGQDVSRFFESGMEEPGRLLISVKGTGMTGQQIYDVLREKYHLQMEMSASDYVVAILSMMDTKEGFDRLWKALWEMDQLPEDRKDGVKKAENTKLTGYCQYHPRKILEISDAFITKNEWVLLDESDERIAAEFVNLYPPGIPIVVPGERIDNRIIRMIKAYLDNGYTVQGVERDREDEGYYLAVVRENDQ